MKKPYYTVSWPWCEVCLKYHPPELDTCLKNKGCMDKYVRQQNLIVKICLFILATLSIGTIMGYVMVEWLAPK